MEHKIYIGCTDPYGDNKPEEIFYRYILPLLKKNRVRNNDIEFITHKVAAMCEIAYANGMCSEAFDRADMD